MLSEKKVSVLRTTVHTAAPLVFSALAQAANHISDRFFLSKASGDALAAVLPGGMLAIMFSTVIMTAIGYSGTVIAQRHGGGDLPGARRAFAQGLWMTLLSVPLFILSIPVGYWFLGLGGHTASLLAAEKGYFLWSTPAGFFGTLSAVLGGLLTGQGRTKRVGTATACGFLANIALDAFLIPSHGINGAGIALSIAAVVPVLILLPMVLTDPLFRANPHEALAFNGRDLWRILRFGLPDAFRCSSGAFFFLAFMQAAGRLGNLTLAVGNVCFAVNNFLYMIGVAVASAVTILTGRTAGAHDLATERATIWSGLKILFLVNTLFYIVVLPISGRIMDAFFPANSDFDPALFRQTGVLIFCIMYFRGLIESTYLILSAALKGRGNTLAAMTIELGCETAVWLPLLAVTLAFHPTMPVLWLTMPAWLAAAIVLQVLRLRFPVRLRNWQSAGMK